MKLIDDWRRAHTFYSVQLAALIAFFGFLQATILPMWSAQLSSTAYATFNSVVATALFLARLIQQGPES